MKKVLTVLLLLLIFSVSYSHAALEHTIIETRQELNRWLVLIDIEDTVTGEVYNLRFQCKVNPDATRLDELVTLGKTRIQAEMDYEANPMNLTTDEDRLLEYYRDIKLDVVLRIRVFPEATVQQAEDYITAEYSDSPFIFTRLYSIWKDMVNVLTWANFKLWVIDHKFRGID